VAGAGTVAVPGGSAASTSHNARAGSSGGAKESGSLPEGPAIRAASISSGSRGGVGWDLAILILVALVALAVPFLVNTLRQRRTMAYAGGAAAAGATSTGRTPERPGPGAETMAPAVAPPAAADAASLWIPAAAPAPAESAESAESAEAAPAPAAEPVAPEAAAAAAASPGRPEPVIEKRRPREPAWLRDHRSQAAMLAAGISGAVRLLRRGRRR
jgi:hypothetical protein